MSHFIFPIGKEIRQDHRIFVKLKNEEKKNIEHTKACPQQPSVSPVSFSATLQPARHPNLSHNGGYLILAPKIKMSSPKHFAFMNICSVSCEKHFSDETYANNYGHWVTKINSELKIGTTISSFFENMP